MVATERFVLARVGGMDNAWDQENLKPEKRLKMAANPTCPVNALLGAFKYSRGLVLLSTRYSFLQ
jgi:hypothetical protein